MGYSRAGFEVVGVDVVRQPHYPFPFIRADAIEYLSETGAAGFDAIHASPPCQAFSQGRNMWHGRLPGDRHPDFIAATRAGLLASGLPYVIENVPGAPLLSPVTVCGRTLGLGVKRHRLFESSELLFSMSCPPGHPGDWISVFGGGGLTRTPPGGSRVNFMQQRKHVAHTTASVAMGIDWMTRDELSQAIPPDYTEFIGAQLIRSLRAAA